MFKCQRGYVLRKIKNVMYLVPYGQQMADLKKGIFLNETGTLLWNTIHERNGCDLPELVKTLADHYELGEEHFPILEKDTNVFIHQMCSMGLLVADLALLDQGTPVHMKIANLLLDFYGPKDLFETYFKDFLIDSCEEDADQKIEFITAHPTSHCYGQVLLRNEDMMILENRDRYVVLFPQMENIYEVHMSLSGDYVRFYCSPEVSDRNCENIFHALRLFFLFIAQKNGLFAIHSASILYRKKAWLFSGHSGIGKTTHTKLWHTIVGTPYLNGDLNLLGICGDKVKVYGIPWCGTSKIYTTKTFELGGIVLLGQNDQTDHLVELNPSEKVLRVMQRMISPSWTEPLLLKNLDFSDQIAEMIPILHLSCTKHNSAVHTIQKEIDRLEDL